MAKRWFVIGSFVVLFIGVFSLVSFIGKSSVVANHSSIILNEQSWQIHFTKPLNASSVKEDRIILKDEEGNVVPVTFTLSNDRKVIIINPPDSGFNVGKNKYVLHLSKKIKSYMGLAISGDNELTISVVEALPTIESEKQLRELLLVDNSNDSIFKIAEMKMESSSEDKASNDSGSIYSETNTQVAGIDEADTVKTDGTYIYSIHHEKIMIIQADGLKEISSINFSSSYHPLELFIDEKKLIVIGYDYNYKTEESKESSVSISSEDKAMVMPNSLTKIKVFDLENIKKPKLVKEVGVEGDYYTSRKQDSFIYVIVNQHSGWIGIPKNETNSLIPNMYDDKKGMYKQDLKQIQYIPQSKESNYVHLLSINIDSSEYNYQVETILGGGDNVYMSKEHLYIASTKYSSGESANTEIYQFNVDDLNVSFSGLGNVEGHTLNQFSMDEYKGYLRIATTENDGVNDGVTTTNSLYILDETMKIVGKLTGLAKDEQIYSVRFMSDKAYIVTFKEVDPLFVIDVSEPTNPIVLGELKIPGYSTYLHPIDENHLIGFGYDTELESNGVSEPFVRNKGMKISLFDIADFHNPKEKDTVIIGGEGTQSPIQYNHKALFVHKERNLYGFPITVYSSANHYEHEFTGALIYEITPSSGIQLKANMISFTDGEYEKWDMEISRLLYVEDDLITISTKEVKAYSLNDFKLKHSLTLPVTY